MEATLQSPARRQAPLPCVAWLDYVTIADPAVSHDRMDLEKQLRLELQRYLREGNYFEAVRLLPGEVAPGERIVTLFVGQFRVRHPFVWPGGSRYETQLWGKLLVRNGNGRLLAQGVSRVLDRDKAISFNKKHEAELRTRMIRELLEQVETVACAPEEG